MKLKGQSKQAAKLIKDIEKSISTKGRYAKTYREYETIKKLYKSVSEKQRAYVNKILEQKGYDASVVEKSNISIIKNDEYKKQINEIRKALIKKTKAGDVLKRTSETKSQFSKIQNVLDKFESKDYSAVSNMELYERYKYYLQFNKYKELKKSMSYEDFKKLMSSGGTNIELVADKRIYKKAKEAYQKLQVLSTKDNSMFGISLQSSSRSDDGKGDFFGRGNKGFGTNERIIYKKILDIISSNKNLKVDEIVRMVLEDKSLKEKIKGNVRDIAEKFAKMR